MAHLEPHSTSTLIAEHPPTHALELPQRFLILEVRLPETGVGLCTRVREFCLGFDWEKCVQALQPFSSVIVRPSLQDGDTRRHQGL